MPEKNDWTVMIFMSCDNNLAVECVWAIKEILRVGLAPKTAVTVQFDSVTEGPKLYDIKKILSSSVTGKRAKLQSETGFDKDGSFLDMGEQVKPKKGLSNANNETSDPELMASPESLKEFLNYSIDNHPAHRYMLVLSGHGSGIVGETFLFDENPPNSLTIPNLRKVMEEVRDNKLGGKPFDIIGMDACSMNMAEVGFELQGTAKYLVGAEGFEETTGWPYYRIIEALKSSKPGKALSPRELADSIVDIYASYYLDYAAAGISVDIASCDLDEATTLADAIKGLGEVLSRKISLSEDRGGRAIISAIVTAHWEAQSYMFEDYVDIWDFCDRLHTASERLSASHRRDIQKHCQIVKGVIEKRYVKTSCYSGAAFQHSHGVSIYLPWVKDEEDLSKYINAQSDRLFSQHTKWGDFISDYVTRTRREERNKGNGKFRPQGDLTEIAVVSALDVRTHPEHGRTHPEHGKGYRRKIARVKNPALDFYEVKCRRRR